MKKMLTRGIVAIPRFRITSFVRRMHVENGPGEVTKTFLNNAHHFGLVFRVYRLVQKALAHLVLRWLSL